MALDYAGIDALYAFGVSDVAWLSDRYSFSVTVPEYSDLDDTYSYSRSKGTRYDPQVGWWSYWTQIIGNELPPWHSGRHNKYSRTQRLFNVFAQPLEEFSRKLEEERRNRFISTADVFQPHGAHRIPVSVRLRSEKRDLIRRNLLRNPEFSIPGLARYALPWAWTDRIAGSDGTVTSYYDNALEGTASIRMYAQAGQICYLRQGVQRVFSTNDSVTASAWVLVPFPTTYSEDSDPAHLVLTLMYEDGSSEMVKQALPHGTAGSWRRIQVTKDIAKRVHRADFMIVLDNDTDHDWEVFVDACQLEASPAATAFQLPPDSVPFWMEPQNQAFHLQAIGSASSRTVEHKTGQGVTYNEYIHRRVFVTNDTFEWWYKAIPTRVGSLSAESGLEATVKTRWGFTAEEETRARRNASFQIASDGSSIDWVVEETPIDVLFSYKLADHFADGGYQDEYMVPEDEDSSYTFVAEALTVHRDLLWIVGKETWNGTTKRILKICLPSGQPDVLADSDKTNFLEVIQDFDLGISSGSATAVAFVEGHDDKLVVTIDGADYSAALWYDYAYWTQDMLTAALLRHSYAGNELVMT